MPAAVAHLLGRSVWRGRLPTSCRFSWLNVVRLVQFGMKHHETKHQPTPPQKKHIKRWIKENQTKKDQTRSNNWMDQTKKDQTISNNPRQAILNGNVRAFIRILWEFPVVGSAWAVCPALCTKAWANGLFRPFETRFSKRFVFNMGVGMVS